jgi:uncharacterized membrane protein YhhN
MFDVMIAVIASVFASVYCINCIKAPHSAWRSFMKMIPLGVPGFGAIWLGSPWMLALGLIASGAGDLALSRPGRPAFLTGLVAFAGAHLFYVALFWNGLSAIPTIPLCLLIVYGMSCEFWLIPHTGALKWPVRIYVVFIIAMAATAFGTGDAMVILGALLFVASDSLLGRGMYRLGEDHPSYISNAYWVWVSYIAAQVLIFLAFA